MNFKTKCKYCNYWSNRDIVVKNDSKLTFKSICLLKEIETEENFHCESWKAICKEHSKVVSL